VKEINLRGISERQFASTSLLAATFLWNNKEVSLALSARFAAVWVEKASRSIIFYRKHYKRVWVRARTQIGLETESRAYLGVGIQSQHMEDPRWLSFNKNDLIICTQLTTRDEAEKLFIFMLWKLLTDPCLISNGLSRGDASFSPFSTFLWIARHYISWYRHRAVPSPAAPHRLAADHRPLFFRKRVETRSRVAGVQSLLVFNSKTLILVMWRQSVMATRWLATWHIANLDAIATSWPNPSFMPRAPRRTTPPLIPTRDFESLYSHPSKLIRSWPDLMDVVLSVSSLAVICLFTTPLSSTVVTRLPKRRWHSSFSSTLSARMDRPFWLIHLSRNVGLRYLISRWGEAAGASE